MDFYSENSLKETKIGIKISVFFVWDILLRLAPLLKKSNQTKPNLTNNNNKTKPARHMCPVVIPGIIQMYIKDC